MKTLFFALALLLGSLQMSIGQDFYLPVSTNSKSARAAYHKAEQLASNINFKEADAQFEKALEEDPNFFMAYVLKIYYTSGEKKATLIDHALAIDATTLNQAEQIVRQQLMIWDENPEATIADNMKALVAAYPNTPQAYHWACLHAAYTDKNTEAALEYAEKLAALSPDFAPNYNTLGYLYLEMQQMNEAKVAFERYIHLLPDTANPYDSMAEYYLINEDYLRSAEYYDKAAKLGMAGAKERADKARTMIKQ